MVKTFVAKSLYKTYKYIYKSNLQKPKCYLEWEKDHCISLKRHKHMEVRSTPSHGSAGEVCVHGGYVVVEGGVLRVPGAGQFELLRRVGELEGGVRVGGVR